MANLIERHARKIVGVLSCFDRLVLQGTLPSVAYSQAMATELDRRGIRLFDYAKQFALPFREAIRARVVRPSTMNSASRGPRTEGSTR